MTRVAIPVWQGRVSPVFDTAGQLLIADVDGASVVARTQAPLGEAMLPRRARRLTELGVDALVCGAISRPLLGMLTGTGIVVVPWIAGNVDEVLGAYLNGQLRDPRFMMPGCMGRGRGRRMRGRGRGGAGPGCRPGF